jgi:hypothetical protein
MLNTYLRGNVSLMQFGKHLLSSALILATATSCLAATKTHHRYTASRLFHKTSHQAAAKPARQRSIDDTRATEIQASLIKSGYLSGEASGHWDSQTEAAMQKFQGDNGWQTKLIPDSRAIIKLGLGPNQDTEASASSSGLPDHQASRASGFMQ